jgi:tetratricopeptide (TPR) repeat protein
VWFRRPPSCRKRPLTSFDRRLGAAAFALFCGAAGARADTITLVDGRTIEADRAWYEGSEVRYEKGTLTAGVPRRLVRSIGQKAEAPSTSDPDVIAARARLAAGNTAEAVRLLQRALTSDPQSVPALETMAEAHLKMGDARKAREVIDHALKVDERCAPCHALRGDAFLAMGDRSSAEIEYQKSQSLRPDSAVERKLASVSGSAAPTPTLPPPTRAPHFRIRYEGAANEPLGVAVLELLNGVYAEYAKRLGSSPDKTITVELQTTTEFLDEGGMPEWAESMNDGAIRVPARGLDKPTPHLVRILRHELAHSFVTEKTGGNCPTWLQEGISQWLEGGDPAREDAKLAIAARQHQLVPLVTMEAPFRTLSEFDAAMAYAESLSAVAHIVRKRGEAGVVRLLSALADGLPAEEALPVALALSYPEFQKSWEEQLTASAAEASR